MKTTRINIETRSGNKRKQDTEQGKSMKSFAKKWLAGLVSAVGVVMLMTSCATTGGNSSPNFLEKGSAKGGASQLMRR